MQSQQFTEEWSFFMPCIISVFYSFSSATYDFQTVQAMQFLSIIRVRVLDSWRFGGYENILRVWKSIFLVVDQKVGVFLKIVGEILNYVGCFLEKVDAFRLLFGESMDSALMVRNTPVVFFNNRGMDNLPRARTYSNFALFAFTTFTLCFVIA